jgi:hypothetical protein
MRSMGLICLATALMTGRSAAHADVVYDYTGTCTSGPTCLASTITMTLDLVSTFTPGSIVTSSDIVRVDDNFGSFPYLGAGSPPPPSVGTSVCGIAPSSGCTGQNLGLQSTSKVANFYSYGDGTWLWQELGGFQSFSGNNGVWTQVAPVPLPAAAWLMLSGLGGLGMVLGKRRAPAFSQSLN